ncbi:DUF2177 family protein [Elioraea rosea]|uniref:DUF2177 family protein n=1 Tax=Elioraea rosea TaxID=2492390 RepID=UPI0011838A2D|nr:DUF2177 family protein [Elioraea rosea]
MTRTHLIAWLGAVIPFLAIDLVWLGVVARDFYAGQLGALMAPKPRWGVALGFYAAYCAGIVLFAVLPGLAAESIWRSVLLGSALGLLAYGTYDMTNLATLRDWPVLMTVVDIAWGTLLTGTVAGLSHLAVRQFG